MARHIDRALTRHEPDAGHRLSWFVESGRTSTSIHRIGRDAIDFAYYARRARKLRTRWIRHWLLGLIGRIDGCMRQRGLKTALYALDDRSLQDIGISHGDIDAIVSGAYVLDETRRRRGVSFREATEDEAGFSTCSIDCDPKIKEARNMTTSISQTPREFAASWVDAWNRHDLDALLAHFSDSFAFSSPFIRQFAGEPSGKLTGKDAVRSYWEIGLTRLPDLHFELMEVLVGVDCLTILYRGHRGLSAEVLELGVDGLVVRGQALYAADS